MNIFAFKESPGRYGWQNAFKKAQVIEALHYERRILRKLKRYVEHDAHSINKQNRQFIS